MLKIKLIFIKFPYNKGISLNVESWIPTRIERKKGKLGAYAMKRVAAGADLPTSWLFEPAKRPDDRADYCLDCSFLHQCKHQVLVFTPEWSEISNGDLRLMSSNHDTR